MRGNEEKPYIMGDLKSFMKNNVMSTANGFVCLPCGKFISRKDSMRRHAEESHVMAGISYQCPICKNIRGSKNSFKVHIYRHHPELKGIKFAECAFSDL